MLKPKKSMAYRAFAVFLAFIMLLFAGADVQAATEGFRINILAVEKNNRVLVEAVNFPEDQTWTVRMGSYYGFRGDNVSIGRLVAPHGGTFQFVVQLPAVVQNVDLISLRLDSQQKNTVYNAFYNETRGNIPDVGSGQVIIPVTGPIPAPNTDCAMTSITLSSPIIMPANHDFTTTWEVKNNSSNNLAANEIDIRFINGAALHRSGNIFDLPATVQPGKTIRLSVDMRSPNQSGIYTANWAVNKGGTILCNLPVTIIVQ